MDTSNILFIFGGAFSGLEDIIKKRTRKKSGIGFGQVVTEEEKEVDFEEVKVEDLVEYGFLPEFLGRIPVIAPLNKLSIEALIEILTKTKNCIIGQYKDLFKLNDINLEVTSEALEEIAIQADKKGTGARGLKSIVEETLLDPMYELPGTNEKEFVLQKEQVAAG